MKVWGLRFGFFFYNPSDFWGLGFGVSDLGLGLQALEFGRSVWDRIGEAPGERVDMRILKVLYRRITSDERLLVSQSPPTYESHDNFKVVV